MSKDALLVTLVMAANSEKPELELGMTLNVTGTIIFGTLMGSHKYLESAKRLFV